MLPFALPRGVIQRVIVGDFGDIVTVSNRQECEAAEREGRLPRVAGFRKTDIVST